MKRISRKPATPGQLRQEAEARLALHRLKQKSSPPTAEALHEHYIRQTELEIQNEQLRLALSELEKVRDRYLELYESAPIGYLILTHTGQIVDINQTGARMLGLERKDALTHQFGPFVIEEDIERWRQLFMGLDKADTLVVEELRLRRKDNTIFPAQVGCRRKDAIDEKPGVMHLVLIDQSTGNAAVNKHHLAAIDFNLQDGMLTGDDANIRYLAFHDPLTNLPNRRLMLDRLGHAITTASRTRKNCAVLFIDLDNFKTLNDTLGHDFGDQLLLQVAQRLLACVREGDTVARQGGDEFIVILENLSEQADESANHAMSIGKKIMYSLNQPYILSGHEYAGSASIGIALFNDPHATAEELLKHADMAMYEAKAAGRNAIRIFDPAMQALVTRRVVLEAELRHALDSHEIQCHFQPQVDAAGNIRGAEVLLRWRHPEHGLMFPASFIRVAEETGLMATIGLWVLETACAQLKTWQDRLPARRRFHLAVNVCARQCHQSNFVEQVRTALEKTGIDPGGLTLEFKEQIVFADIDASIGKMAALKKLGVRLAIDDFGTGCSSLSQLTQLPLDQLKIDLSLVRDISVKPTDEVIIQTLIDVAKRLGVEVLAEGVETEAQHAFLGQHGCHAFQGFLFGKALPACEFEQLLGPHWRHRKQTRVPARSHPSSGPLASRRKL